LILFDKIEFLKWYEKGRFKLPREYYSSKYVIGNGMSLGLTNGTNNYGLTAGNGYNYPDGIFRNNAYGQNQSTTITQTDTGTGILGVTTDPAKSGITVNKDTSKYLFFFVN